MSKLLSEYLFRPQGQRMDWPMGVAAKIQQSPYRHFWHEAWMLRFFIYGNVLVVIPLYWQISKVLTGPENKKYWKEKRAHDREHHRKEMEKLWEVRT